MSCFIDESALPILTGCPGPNELVVVGNAIGGLDAEGGYTTGYARRKMGDINACFLQNLVFVPLQFTIGSPGSPMSVGDTVLLINQPTIIEDSVSIVLEGTVLDRNDSTQVSYILVYNDPVYSGKTSITFNQAASAQQTYIVNYAYAN